MLRRLEYCRKTLNAYLDRKIDSIPELEEEILPYMNEGVSALQNDALKVMTPSAMYFAGTN